MAIAVDSSATSPATNHFSALKTQIARYVMLPDDDDALVAAGDGINDAILELNVEAWWFTLTKQDLTLVADTATYTLNALFNMARSMELLDSNSKTISRMSFMSWKSFVNEYYDRDSSGTPYVYSVRNAFDDSLVEFSCPPDSNYVSSYPTARLHYYKRVAKLVGNADVPDVPSEVELYLKWSAKAYVATIFKPDMYMIAEREKGKIWRALRRKNVSESDYDWDEG